MQRLTRMHLIGTQECWCREADYWEADMLDSSDAESWRHLRVLQQGVRNTCWALVLSEGTQGYWNAWWSSFWGNTHTLRNSLNNNTDSWEIRSTYYRRAELELWFWATHLLKLIRVWNEILRQILDTPFGWTLSSLLIVTPEIEATLSWLGLTLRLGSHYNVTKLRYTCWHWKTCWGTQREILVGLLGSSGALKDADVEAGMRSLDFWRWGWRAETWFGCDCWFRHGIQETCAGGFYLNTLLMQTRN